MPECSTCREYYFQTPHACSPLWHVWLLDEHAVGDITDSVKVRADSAQKAAERVMESRKDSGKYIDISDPVFVRVLVRRADTGEERRFLVYAEVTIHWNIVERCATPPEGARHPA